MEKGLAICEMTDNGTRAVFIDQEVLEYAKLNLRTKSRVADQEKEQNSINRRLRNAQIAEARRKAYNRKTLCCLLMETATIAAITCGGFFGLISPVVCFCVSLALLCAVCVRFGIWYGRMKK